MIISRKTLVRFIPVLGSKMDAVAVPFTMGRRNAMEILCVAYISFFASEQRPKSQNFKSMRRDVELASF